MKKYTHTIKYKWTRKSKSQVWTPHPPRHLQSFPSQEELSIHTSSPKMSYGPTSMENIVWMRFVVNWR